jgi:hypothetical protein
VIDSEPGSRLLLLLLLLLLLAEMKFLVSGG